MVKSHFRRNRLDHGPLEILAVFALVPSMVFKCPETASTSTPYPHKTLFLPIASSGGMSKGIYCKVDHVS